MNMSDLSELVDRTIPPPFRGGCCPNPLSDEKKCPNLSELEANMVTNSLMVSQ